MTDWPTTDAAGWRAAIDALRVEEKAATRTLDALAAKRRRLPMVEFDAGYRFEGPDGERETRRTAATSTATSA